jgi:hypothetical protein
MLNKIFSRGRDLKIIVEAVNWHLVAADTRVHAMFSPLRDSKVPHLMTRHLQN